MRKQFLLLAVSLPFLGMAQWTKVSSVSGKHKVNESVARINSKIFYDLDAAKLHSQLQNVTERRAGGQGVIISLPNAEGKVEKFRVWELSNMVPDLQAKFPQIRSYVGNSLQDPSAYLRFSTSPQGLSSMISRSGKSEYIEPMTADSRTYIVFDATQRKMAAADQEENFVCEVKGNLDAHTESTGRLKAAGSNTMRLALACTGEYGQYFLTKAGIPASASDAAKKAAILAAMNATLTRLNGVYERDLSLHYNMIAETESLIFYNATTDPFSTGGGPDTANTGINSTLGTGATTKYDLGHLIDKKDANGAAYLGVICGSSLKAGGWTAHNIPEGATFDIDYVSHEMGHQMGAGHTYTFYSNQLDQRVEPGSGSTIMAYTGITGNFDVQYNSHDNFHYSSLTQIKNKLNAVVCGTNVPYNLPQPTVNAGADMTIPKMTPFVVNATSTDPSTTAYTYTFDQIDQAATAQIGANSIAYETKPTGPNFRALAATAIPYRSFPDYDVVLSGVYSTRWESLASVARPFTIGVTLRNNNAVEPNIARAEVKLTVDANSGPFKVTAPVFGESLVSGSAYTVKWDVANTTAAPVSTTNVSIKISKDGGQSFTTLAASTPNDGQETVTVPTGFTASNAYILIEALGNVYYAVSPSFVIDYNVTGESCATYTSTGGAVQIKDGPGGNGISSPKIEVPLTISNSGLITKVAVTPDIAHTNVGHLSFGVESPVGTSVLLMDHQCNGRSGITATFNTTATSLPCTSPVAGSVKPFQPLNVFAGHNAAGVWKLFASDNTPGIVGTVNSWSLEVCTRDTQALAVNDTSGMSKNIRVYPNPSNGNFFIKSRDLGGKAVATVYDLSGKSVYTTEFNASKGELTSEMNTRLPKGVYMLNINSPAGNYTQKLIIN